MTAATEKPVWFITGCSTGFGRQLALHTLSLGYPTVVTARNPQQVEDIVKGHEHNALVLKLDVTDKNQVDEARKMFEINVWGLTDMTRAVLPGMRKQRSGTIVNISSVGGITTFPTTSFYHASKFAVEALSESMAQEVAPLGIKVLIVEPSGFRTDWAGRSANQASETIDDYRETAGTRTTSIRAISGKQAGDPVRAAVAIVNTVEAQDPPLRLLLGKAALAGARNKVKALNKDFEGWAAVTEGADFPD